ncbi:DUF5723 family protein [Aquiflexum lacus]|uniref:DUF5723 family protein n=1 Tax=Aquiflexum lacus TaxID=2483805 RepID=UPI0018955823|nr:DUF5723 family protein [Aquiflexum lacus]
MKKILFTLLLSGFSFLTLAQSPYIGIQSSQRKNMISAMMNPAELNNLSKPVEVNFFATNASLINNTLSFGEIVNNNSDIWQNLLEESDIPITGIANVSFLIPSVGIKLGKWSLGFASQIHTSAAFLNVDPDLAQYVTDSEWANTQLALSLISSTNQRTQSSTWFETGILVGREIWDNSKSKLSVGTNFKLLFPYQYLNVGVENFQGAINTRGSEVILSDALGNINFSYNSGFIDAQNFSIDYSAIGIGRVNGLGVDLGLNYQLKDEKGIWFSSGLAFRNLGSMKFTDGHVNHTFRMDIPAGEEFRIDLLESDLRSIETQFLESGYFSYENQQEGIRANLPSVIALNAEMRLTSILYVAFYGQKNLNNENRNNQIPIFNMVSLTPSILIGKFEIYSPWVYNEISRLNGGLGLRFGGFFIGSQSVISGLIADTRKVDFHMGLSWGFGKVK